ncbi:MAG: adenylate cyclase [Algoriphagus sp.]|jgi:adenylate cyclase
MPIEIERKYLVKKDLWIGTQKSKGELYRQGYLVSSPEKTIRVRLTPNKAFLTIKGKSSGAARVEYEYEIPRAEAKDLLDNFAESELSKTRFKVFFEGKTWEIDDFHGENEGLLMAEIELNAEDEYFEIPEWVGVEVTGLEQYYNSTLTILPFTKWKNA